MPKQRLDSLLVAKGLLENKAHALIMAGEVTVNGKVITKAGSLVAEDSAIEIALKPPYVSRGGIKLAHALDEFKLNVTSLIAMDIGASTGGFTDCLLQRGAGHVYALDVGYGQLDYKLRQDPRVTVMDKANAHYSFSLPEKTDLATVDVSFISVTKVIPNTVEHLKPSGYLIVLLKPQFEAEKQEVGKGGIIKDPLIHARVLARFILWAIDHNFRLRGLVASPITGADGNQEFLLLLAFQPHPNPLPPRENKQ
jgi:23S rRNA (cytidine1920-2'-O)/16S rRNA (cytidine1409-2'-O)-methyltransferase